MKKENPISEKMLGFCFIRREIQGNRKQRKQRGVRVSHLFGGKPKYGSKEFENWGPPGLTGTQKAIKGIEDEK